jgi:sialate O-acetylesterase
MLIFLKFCFPKKGPAMRLRVIFLFIFLSHSSLAQIKLPMLISENMVLQRDTPLNLWGWASPGEKIRLKFELITYKATTGNDGKWNIKLPPHPAGGPLQITIEGSNKIILNNILFGDVWLCSGQSNMVINMERVKEKYPEDIAHAEYPLIRNFFVPTATQLGGPLPDLPLSAWKQANPKDVLQFGALTFFFARQLYEKYKVPIGIINSSVGGTPIEAWTSEEGFKEMPAITSVIQKNKDTAYIQATNRAASSTRAITPIFDQGVEEPVKWFDEKYIPKNWRNINIPGYWEDQGMNNFNGIVWYRKEIILPATVSGKAAKIFMGRIVDADEMYINGIKVGNITYQYPPRRYQVAQGILKEGKNILTIRVTNTSGKGGFVPDKRYELVWDDFTLDLKGTWQYKVGDVFTPSIPSPSGINAQNQPTALYNAMIAPLTFYPVKGFIWYQGESNTGAPGNYGKLLEGLIHDWRNKWRQADAPFLFVQLPNFMDYAYLPSESNWAILRNNQRKALTVSNTAMVVTTDCGEWNDIHPLNKKDVGLRLSLAAEKLAYHENIEYSGPLYEKAIIDHNIIMISFTHTGSGLITRDGDPLRYFSIAGEDKKFMWAKAEIINDQVKVWHDHIPNPMYVRYNWADNPDGNLYNKEGLPAAGFKTDED